jgi:isopentenyl-diphosphate delta-isomerase
LEDPERHLVDFDVRDLMPGRPLFANLGIAQIERALENSGAVHRMVEQLRADGLIIHVNPLQEWFQPGGDVLRRAPLETITRFLETAPYPVMVKEVGHGMGPASLRALMKLPLAAIEFAAYGGTNFSVLEARRAGEEASGLTRVGHTAADMVGYVRTLLASGETFRCERFIVSGGVVDVLQGHHLIAQLPGRAVFGMAHAVLGRAQEGAEALRTFLTDQRDTYAMAQAYLRPAQGAP